MIKKLHVALAAIIVMVLIAFALGQGFFGGEKTPEKPKPPSVSIGCDRAVWNGKEAGSCPDLIKKFEIGEHRIMITVRSTA